MKEARATSQIAADFQVGPAPYQAQPHSPLHHSPQGSIVLPMDDEDQKAEMERRDRLSQLARRLPSLVDAPGLAPPMDALALARWAADKPCKT